MSDVFVILIAVGLLVLGSTALERRLHDHWAGTRIRGEWFGEGCAEAIIALAEETAKRQIAAYRIGGSSLDYIREGVAEDVGLIDENAGGLYGRVR